MQKRARNVFVSCYFQSEKAYIYLLPVVTPLWTLLLSSGEAPNLYTTALFPKASPTSVTVRQTKGEKKGLFLCRVLTPQPQLLPWHKLCRFILNLFLWLVPHSPRKVNTQLLSAKGSE